MSGWRRRRWTAPPTDLVAAGGGHGGHRGDRSHGGDEGPGEQSGAGRPGGQGGQVRRRLGGWALASAGGLAAFTILHVWTPSEGPGFTVCPLRLFTGLPCPGCGMTRAFAHLAKGEWSAAVHNHPLAPLLAAELALVWAAWGGAAAGLVRLPVLVKPEAAALCHLAVLVAVWLGRMATGTLT